ncbi:hypothetical protein AHAS_Ahas13G0146200 [Arachis hypogaea]
MALYSRLTQPLNEPPQLPESYLLSAIQRQHNDLVHGWGMDMKLGYCAQADVHLISLKFNLNQFIRLPGQFPAHPMYDISLGLNTFGVKHIINLFKKCTKLSVCTYINSVLLTEVTIAFFFFTVVCRIIRAKDLENVNTRHPQLYESKLYRILQGRISEIEDMNIKALIRFGRENCQKPRPVKIL